MQACHKTFSYPTLVPLYSWTTPIHHQIVLIHSTRCGALEPLIGTPYFKRAYRGLLVLVQANGFSKLFAYRSVLRICTWSIMQRYRHAINHVRYGLGIHNHKMEHRTVLPVPHHNWRLRLAVSPTPPVLPILVWCSSWVATVPALTVQLSTTAPHAYRQPASRIAPPTVPAATSRMLLLMTHTSSTTAAA